MRLPRFSVSRDSAIDWALTCGLGFGYLVVLLLSARQLGYARDEGFYFQAAASYGRWFELFLSAPGAAIERVNVDQFWSQNHEHPALIKSLFWASHKWLRGLPLIADHGTAYRFPAMALSALCVSVIYAWGRQIGGKRDGRVIGVIAALSFAFMPQVFYHAHLACFDMPVAAMWFITTYAYWRCSERSSWGWLLATGVLYGLLLNTKHNSWILPGALFLHLLLDRSLGLRTIKLTKLGIPLSWIVTPVIAPAVFFLTWPWIWFNTFKRLEEYVKFHTGHVYYNMEFLGQTYFKPPMPRLYAWVMTIGTVPTITISLFLLGLIVFWSRGLWPSLLWRVRHTQLLVQRLLARVSIKYGLPPTAQVPQSSLDETERNVTSTMVLWVLCIAASYAPWLLKKTPIFGGTKHWITAYPFMCLIAGVGFVVVARLAETLFESVWLRRMGNILTGALVVGVPMVIAVAAQPWGLAAYVPMVGGAPGAASLGLNRSFWGYTTASVAPHLKEHAKKGARIFVHDTALQSWQMMEKDKIVRSDLRPWQSVHGSQWAVYHHEQHMSRVEFMTWVDYGTTTPAQVATYDGVPIVWLYERPPAPRTSSTDAPNSEAAPSNE